MTDIIKKHAKKIENTEYLDIFKVILFAPNRTKNREPLLYTLNGYEDLLVSDIYVFPDEINGQNVGMYGFTTQEKNKPVIYLNEKLFTKYTPVYNAVGTTLFHEILHQRLSHIKRFEHYFRINSMLTNFVLDLFIQEIVYQFIDDPKEIKENSICFENFEKNIRNGVNTLGMLLKPNLKGVNIEQLKKMSDYELMEFFFDIFEDISQQISQMISESIDKHLNNQNSQQNQGKQDNDNQQNQEENNQQNQGNNQQNQGGNNQQNQGVQNNNNQEQNNNQQGQGSQENFFDLLNNIFNDVANQIRNKAKNDPKFKEDLANASSFGPLDNAIKNEIIRQLIGENNEVSDYDDEKNRRILEGFLEKNKKHIGNTGGFLRNILDTNEKIKIPQFVLQLFNRLYRGGYFRHRIVYPKKSFRSNDGLVLGKKKYFGLEMYVIVDTSGSMGNEDLEKSIKILRFLVENNANVHLYFNDVDFQEIENVNSVSKLHKSLKNGVKGGGGSVFDKVFEHVSKKNIPGIVITDLHIYGLEKMPKDVVVIATEGYDKQAFNDLMSKGYLVVRMEDLE
ncbi:hypothetical protein YS40_107 [Thermus phage phiYS40]|uniref:hypothetical protein n=1 Tax=Thermus phage phiYS40 TaxID=407392 RepID=UPI0000E689E1|nr:hypothetical protein YS40_107 [Thermus phage phiYS40]ABJ91501.1 hypothetical protein YS40_107 [Thermus phage phiYS40]BAK53625.1 hypothetical protein YSP_107 [Thermus phage phiYS40]